MIIIYTATVYPLFRFLSDDSSIRDMEDGNDIIGFNLDTYGLSNPNKDFIEYT